MTQSSPNNNTLIILPGWGGTKETWADFVTVATPYFRSVNVIELPCFGSNPCPKTVWGVEEYAEYVKLKLSKMPSGNTVLLGHSFGGAVAACLVAKHPEIVKKLVLSGSPIFRKKHGVRWYFFAITAKIGKVIFKLPGIKFLENLAKKVLYKVADSPDYNKTSGIQREIFKKITNQDFGHILNNISVPTMVIWGTNDTYVPIKEGKNIAKNIPGANFIEIKDGRHGLHVTSKDVFLQHLLLFCK